MSTALTTDLIISSTSFSFCISAEPAALLQTFLAGQPILMSIIWAPNSTACLADSASSSASEPAIWILIGDFSELKSSRCLDLLVLRRCFCSTTISEVVRAAPCSLHIILNGLSLVPAIGASKTFELRWCGPMFIKS